MKNLEELKTFCRLQYQDCALPIYCYQAGELIFFYPEQSPDTFPPPRYLHELAGRHPSVSYCSSEYGIYFGSVSLHEFGNSCLILGPVSNIPYSDSMFHHMYSDYVILPDKRNTFQQFFQICPQMSLNSLLLKLIFINYCLNHEVLTLESVSGKYSETSVQSKTIEALFQRKEDMLHNQSHEVEAVYLDCIRSGNVKRLEEFAFNESAMHAGTLASTSLRQLKNIIIVTTTLATRAAIEGGLDADSAYHLSDYYIQNAESADNPDVLYHLLGVINHDFAEKVAEQKVPRTSDDILQKAIRYVLQNTNTPLKVTDVAEYVGFSRSYFSSYFKEKLGFSISAFILRCKLEESKQLLAHTEKSLSVISAYLCFSSQSHFQTSFKKQFGVTPLQYRKNPAIHNDVSGQ